MYVPEEYYHKATNESYNGGEKVVIHYSTVDDNYLVVIGVEPDEMGYYFTKTQLELVVLAGSDVLQDEQV